MKVKLETACSWQGIRREAGSVIEVPVEVQELNADWMKPTDDPISDAKPAAGKKADADQ